MRALVTGGAGFIGSSLADRLLAAGHHVRVLDDLSAGVRDHVPAGSELVEGDVSDPEVARRAVNDVEIVFHQAAHRAVLQSVSDPVATDLANTHGTVVLLKASVDAGVRRLLYASSSSVYGGAAELPTREEAPTSPQSPYAVSKLAGEHYCRVFNQIYGLETVSLRYFNVYGPRQRPDSAYAAVVPLFVEAVSSGRRPEVHGDGLQSRSFTFIDDVVDANLAAAEAPPEACRGQAYNIAGVETDSVLGILRVIKELMASDIEPVHTAPRPGDIRHSAGDASAAAAALGYKATCPLGEGLQRTIDWLVRDRP